MYHIILDSRAENFSNPMHILYQKVKKNSSYSVRFLGQVQVNEKTTGTKQDST